jgi:hypothetical protein
LAALLSLTAVCAVATLFFPGTPWLGVLGGWGGLAVAPGFAVSRWLAPHERNWLTACRALFLSPLITGVLAMGLLFLGIPPAPAGAAIAVVAFLAAFITLGFQEPFRSPSPWERRLVLWCLVLAATILIPHAASEAIRARSDAWFHTAVVLEMKARGIPPGDPYFAGLPLNYAWFHHVVLLVWSSMAGARAYDVGGLVNAGWLVSLAGGVYSLSRRAGRPSREAFFAAVFVPVGLSAAFTLWLPVKVLRAFLGETGGVEHLRYLFDMTPFGFERVYHLTSSWGSVPALVNKFLVMTVYTGAVTGAVWVMEGLVGLIAVDRRRRHARRRALGLWWAVAAAVFGCWVLHPAVAVAVVGSAALAGMILLARPGPVLRRVVMVAAGAVLLGTAAAYPVLGMSVTRAGHGLPFGFDPAAAAAIAISSTAALLLGVPGLRRIPGWKGAPRTFLVLCWTTMVASLAVALPPPNTADKMAFVFYLMPAVSAGWVLGRWWYGSRRTGRVALVWAGLLLLLVPVNALYVAAVWFERDRPAVPAAEGELYAVLAAETPPDAVILDTAERDDVLVRVPRRQFWGREPYARQWGYDPMHMSVRRAVRDAWNPPGAPPRSVDPRAVRALDAFAAVDVGPLYLVWRPEDHDGLRFAEAFSPRDRARFEPVWANEAGEVLRYRPAGRR